MTLNMRTIKYILTAFAILVCSVAIGQNPVDTVNVQSKVKSRGRVRKVKPEPVLLDSLKAPAEAYSDAYLDTVKLNRVFEVNDYSLIGVEYGVSFSRMSFNPAYSQTTLFSQNTF